MNHFQEIPLGQLRVIRGNSLYERRFALSVFLNYPKDGSSGLKQLGLMNLTGMEGGGVCLVHHLVPSVPANYEILNKKSLFLFQHKSTNHFTEILDGGVQIINNKYLRYGPWVYWQDIIRNNAAPIEIQFNGERGECLKIKLPCILKCPPIFFTLSLSGVCHKSCGNYCWGPGKDHCQICECPVLSFLLPSSSRNDSIIGQ